jgi:SAM-dependent methyltransferase
MVSRLAGSGSADNRLHPQVLCIRVYGSDTNGMGDKQHWDRIYTVKPIDKVSWYREHLDASLHFIERAALPSSAAIIDVGGGASPLVDDLLTKGYTKITVLDISDAALKAAKARVGDASSVRWIVGDVTQTKLETSHYDLWHDRAVFHFLTDAIDRARYVDGATQAIKPSGFLIVATFAPEGPLQCSGLPVNRYSAPQLADQFTDFRLIESVREEHYTPAGTIQPFTYVFMQRRS